MLRSAPAALALAHLLSIFSPGQDTEDAAALRPGVSLAGDVGDEDPVLGTEALAVEDPLRPPVGKPLPLVVGERQALEIELRSAFFDAYLVLRDEAGEVLGEDDDGLFPTDARLSLELDPGTYLVEAIALRGGRGPFVLSAKSAEGTAAPADPASRATGLALFPEAKRIVDLEPVDAVEAWSSLAVELRDAGLFELAETVALRAVELGEVRLGQVDPRTAWALITLSAALRDRGLYDRALPHAERALGILEGVHGKDSPDVVESLNLLGILLLDTGVYQRARPLLERALAICERDLGLEDPLTIDLLNNLSNVHRYQGFPAEARPLLERALRTGELVHGPDHPETADHLSNLAALLMDIGGLEEAEHLFRRALSIRRAALGPHHPATADAESYLASTLTHLGRFDEAREAAESALATAEEVLGPDHPTTLAGLVNLGELLWAQRDLQGARPLLERALEISERTLGPDHSDTAVVLINLGKLYTYLGLRAEAREAFERALALRLALFGAEHPLTAQGQKLLARSLFDGGDAEEAWKLMRTMERNRRAHLARALRAQSEPERFGYLASLFSDLELQLGIARSIAASMDRPEVRVEAYEALLAWKGRVLRSVAQSRARLAQGLGRQARLHLEELAEVQAELSRALLGDEGLEREARDARLESLRYRRGELELLIEASLPAPTGADVSFADLASRLPEDAAFLDFLVHEPYRPRPTRDETTSAGEGAVEPELTVWVTRKGSSEPLRLDLGPARAAEEATAAFLRDLVAERGEPVDEGSRSAAAAVVRAAVWDPIAPHLEGVRTVLVSPDGFLGTLPLGVLEDREERLLLERFRFVHAPDASFLAGDAPAATAAALLACGGLDFGERAVATGKGRSSGTLRGSFARFWGRLPHTTYEAQVVHDLHAGAYPDGTRLLLTEEEATEERLKRELPRHAVLHLATHGFFQPEGLPSMWEEARDRAGGHALRMREPARRLVGSHPGLLSGLVCSGANAPPSPGDEGRDDGFLTAEEVSWLDLSRVELVVLSACETALGSPRSGEGMMGLRRSFHIAGARTVVSSLWSVKDRSTSELMQAFYRNLWVDGMGALDALHAAQLEMLKRNRIEHGRALPSTWGAFVLSGEWR